MKSKIVNPRAKKNRVVVRYNNEEMQELIKRQLYWVGGGRGALSEYVRGSSLGKFQGKKK